MSQKQVTSQLKNSEISEVQAQKGNNNSSYSQEKNESLSTQCAKNKPNMTEDNILKNKSIKNMQQSQNFNKKTLIININKTSKYEMGSNKIVKTMLSHKSKKEQNKVKSQKQNNISDGPMQSDHKSATNQNKSKEQNQFQAAFKEEANKSQLHTNNENENRSGHRSLSEEYLHFDTSCSNKRRQKSYDSCNGEENCPKIKQQRFGNNLDECLDIFNISIALGPVYVCTYCLQTWFKTSVHNTKNIKFANKKKCLKNVKLGGHQLTILSGFVIHVEMLYLN